MKSTTFRSVSVALFVALAALFSAPRPAEAQIWKKVKKAAKNAAENQTANEVDNLVRNAVHCAFDDLQCVQQAQDDGQQVVLTDEDGTVLKDEDGNPITDPDKLPADKKAKAETKTAANANYDFEPGSDVLFQEDYSKDNVGDFPRHMVFVKGNWEIVDREGQRFLRNTGPRHSSLMIPLSETLPETFTIELTVLEPPGNVNLALSTSPPNFDAGGTRRLFASEHNYVDIGSWGVGINSRDKNDPTASVKVGEKLTAAPVPIRIMVDGSYMKVFVDSQRVANVPNADIERSDTLWLENTYDASPKRPILVGGIRVAAGGRDLYDVLEAKGRVSVNDILFDTDKSTIKPASAKTLETIGSMLKEHADLKLMIEGHTDDQGGFDHNMKLSGERAAAVKAYLVDRLGVDEGRLRTMGLGQTQPVADNSTEEGRAQNRRVELVQIND